MNKEYFASLSGLEYTSDENTIFGIQFNSPEVGFFIKNTSFLYQLSLLLQKEILEDYYLYGFDSLLSDTGGFLGLLLGYSLFSLINTVAEFLLNFNKPK